MMIADQSSPEENPVNSSPGTLLRQARESAGLSQEDVAGETRMTLLKVRALEADDFASLHSDTFVRGYLRIYAKLVKLEPEALLLAYRQARIDAGLEEEPDESPLQLSVNPPGRPLWHFAIWIIVILAGLWVLSVWFFDNRSFRSDEASVSVLESDRVDSAPTESANAMSVRQPSTREPEMSPAVGSESPGVVEQESLAEAGPEEELDLSEAAPALMQIQGGGSSPDQLDQLELSFSEECWLVVTDARGDVLHTDLVQPGQDLSLMGYAPFEVKLGNAPAVQLALNGEPFDLEVPAGRRLMTLAVGE